MPVNFALKCLYAPRHAKAGPGTHRDDRDDDARRVHSDCVPFGCVTKLFSHASPSLNDAHHRPGFSRLESTRAARSAQPGGSAGGDGGGLGGAGGGAAALGTLSLHAGSLIDDRKMFLV